MASRMRRSTHDYERLPRTSEDSTTTPELHLDRQSSRYSWLDKLTVRSVYTHYVTPRRRRRSLLRLIYWSIFSLPYVILFSVLLAATFFPSYTHRPAHYNDLRERALRSNLPGRTNVNNEKVFIAASIYEEEGSLTSGAWGQSLLDLVHLLGPQNVHLSLYENDADSVTKESLAQFEKKVTCNSTILAEDLDLSTLPRVTLPTGETRLKRIAFLAEVRNRALAPLDTTPVQFDKVLYVNDVYFDPVEAVQLLLSTNIDETGRANYGAACAVDFINAFKFYDRFALRDMEGYTSGVPLYPWFTSAGAAMSRNDVLSGTDAVRVRSCWGGMTAFEAKWFQDQKRFEDDKADKRNLETTTLAPLRFRYDEATFWDSSECCLIHADLEYRRTGTGFPPQSAIYMNPYIRVAYDTKTLSWLSFTRRPERLYALLHDLLNHIVGFPTYNERRTDEPGQEVVDTVWVYDDPAEGLSPNATNADLAGQWEEVKRTARVGEFCGTQQLLVINENPAGGEGRWGQILAPRPPQ